MVILSKDKTDDAGASTNAANISERMRERELLRKKIRTAISSVDEEHYEQWAGMGPGQVLVFGKFLGVVIAQLESYVVAGAGPEAQLATARRPRSAHCRH